MAEEKFKLANSNHTSNSIEIKSVTYYSNNKKAKVKAIDKKKPPKTYFSPGAMHSRRVKVEAKLFTGKNAQQFRTPNSSRSKLAYACS
jgi:hypothetical protein